MGMVGMEELGMVGMEELVLGLAGNRQLGKRQSWQYRTC
jgi:hypothetical protein